MSMEAPSLAFCQALIAGDVEALRSAAADLSSAWLGPNHDALNASARRGHLAALQYVDGLPQVRVNWAEVVQEAAHGGHLDLVQWLIPRSLDTALQGALGVAAHRGHTDVVAALAPHVSQDWATATLVNHWPARPKLLSALRSRVAWSNQLQRFLLDCISAGDAFAVRALFDAFPGQKIWLDGARTAMRSPLDDDTIIEVVRRCSTDPASPFIHEPVVHALNMGLTFPHRLDLFRRLCQEVPTGEWPAEDMSEVWLQAVELKAPDDMVRELVNQVSPIAVGEHWLASDPPGEGLPFTAFDRFAPWVNDDSARAWWTMLGAAAQGQSVDDWESRVPGLTHRMEVLARHASAVDRGPTLTRPRSRA